MYRIGLDHCGPPGIRAAWFLRYGIRERKLTNDDTHMGEKTKLLHFAAPSGA
jgi:hypothetical protein